MADQYKKLQAFILESEGLTPVDGLIDCQEHYGCRHSTHEIPIELARVLRALVKKNIINLSTHFDTWSQKLMLFSTVQGEICDWNLDHPLNLQSEKTITNLTEILS